MNNNPCHLCRFLFACLLATLFLVLSGASGAWADDTYTSEDSNYPSKFDNNCFDGYHNDLQYMDAVYFGGREVVFFTLLSTLSDQDASNGLYLYTPGYDFHGKMNIQNNKDNNFRFTTCVFNDKLYIFYTTEHREWYGTDFYAPIYYLTAEPFVGDATSKFIDGENSNLEEHGTNDYRLYFSGYKSFIPGGFDKSDVIIVRWAGVMNGKLYVFFEADGCYYAVASDDGHTFSSPKLIRDNNGYGYNLGGTVFQVPDAENGQRDVIMLASCPNPGNGGIDYFFFDGETVYGENSISTDGLSPRSVNLIAQTAEGYNSKNFSIQAFLAYPDKDGSDKSWSRIYHREYVPSGDNGDQGTWSSSWTYLSNDSKDHIHCYNDYESNKRWAVTPSFTDENSNLRMSLNIWYARGTDFDACKDIVKFRHSSYKSDFLVLENSIPTKADSWGDDLSAGIVLMIIEGTPPFPKNGHEDGDLGVAADNTSVLQIGTAYTSSVSFNYMTSGAVTYSVGVKVPEKFSVNTSLTMGGKYAKNTTTSRTATFTKTLKTYQDKPAGDYGWAMVFMPDIMTYQYGLKSYDGVTALTYSNGPNDDEVRMYVIQYTESSKILEKAYNLEDPSFPIGGTVSYTEWFEGMTARPLSTDISGNPEDNDNGWVGVTDEYTLGDPSYGPSDLKDKIITKGISSTQGEASQETYSSVNTEVETKTYYGSYTVSAKKLGITSVGLSANFSYSLDWSTSTTITDNVGFWLNIPECCNPLYNKCPDPNPCIADITVDPVLLIPNEDDTGYDAPWISDDIKTYKKPKPLCLSYLVYPTTSLEVGASGDHETVGDALEASSEFKKVNIQVNDSVTEKNSLFINVGTSVTVKGAASTIDGIGNPTVTIAMVGITVEEGAILHFENVIIKAATADPLIRNNGNLSFKNCKIIGDAKGDGIVQDGGALSMEKTYLSQCGGDGIQVQNGSVSLINCAVTDNTGIGIDNENGTVFTEYCTVLQSAAFDLSTGVSAVTEMTNTVVGKIAPDSRISKLLNCLIETLPESVVIEAQQDSLLNMSSGYVVDDGSIDILPDSPCVNAGAVAADVKDDINGAYRDQQPDIGALEYYHAMEIKSIDALALTIMDTDPATLTDSLHLVLSIKVPTGFSVLEDARYGMSFGTLHITSDQFDSSSKNDNSLEFTMNSGDSTLKMDLSSDKQQLKMSLDLSDVSLYQDISPYLLNYKEDDGDTSTVFLPIRADAGDFQTGEKWMHFRYEVKNGVGTGSDPEMVSSGSSDSDDDDDACFISILKW